MPKNNQYSFLVIVHKEDKINKNIFKLIPLYTVSTQVIKISFTDQLPTSDVSSEEFLLCWHQNFQQSTI
jgi:hypothetical protein